MPGKAENPYSALLRLMRAQGSANNPPSWDVGEVTQLAPVKILFRGIVLEPSQLFWPHGFSNSQLQIGSKVAVLPDPGYNLFLVLGERVI